MTSQRGYLQKSGTNNKLFMVRPEQHFFSEMVRSAFNQVLYGCFRRSVEGSSGYTAHFLPVNKERAKSLNISSGNGNDCFSVVDFETKSLSIAVCFSDVFGINEERTVAAY